jgi:hypothetical protein
MKHSQKRIIRVQNPTNVDGLGFSNERNYSIGFEEKFS